MNVEREVDFWDLPDQEELRYSDKNEAIEMIIDKLPEDQKTFELCGYSRMIHHFNPDVILMDILENTDFDFGDPDDYTKPTKAMKAAAKAFTDVLDSEYTVHACEEICRETINIDTWKTEQGVRE